MKKGNITREIEETKKFIRSYYKNLYSINLEILEKIDGFLDRYCIPNLNHQQKNCLNMHIINKAIKKIIKNLPTKNCTVPDRFRAEFYKTFTDTNIPQTIHKKVGEILHYQLNNSSKSYRKK